MPFPTRVYLQPAPAVEGDFASANPRHNVLAGPGQLIAGSAGVTIGRFAWMDASGTYVSNKGAGPVTGFVHREQQGLITAYLQESGMLIPGGFGITLHNAGDFWAVNRGPNIAKINDTVYADLQTGNISTGPANTPPSAASGTASIAPATSAFTGSISGNVLTVTNVSSGPIVAGEAITGTSVATGTTIVSQTSGTAGAVGTYTVNIPQTVASTSMTGTYGTMTVTGSPTGTIAVGDPVTGSGVTAGTVVTALGTGTGGAGTYIVSPSQTASSTTVTVAGGVQTKFLVMSIAAPGELVKISSSPLG